MELFFLSIKSHFGGVEAQSVEAPTVVCTGFPVLGSDFLPGSASVQILHSFSLLKLKVTKLVKLPW